MALKFSDISVFSMPVYHCKTTLKKCLNLQPVFKLFFFIVVEQQKLCLHFGYDFLAYVWLEIFSPLLGVVFLVSRLCPSVAQALIFESD